MIITKLEINELANGVISMSFETKGKTQAELDATDLLLKAFCVNGARRGGYDAAGRLSIMVKPQEE